jgi:sodium/hydrogen antiporter
VSADFDTASSNTLAIEAPSPGLDDSLAPLAQEDHRVEWTLALVALALLVAASVSGRLYGTPVTPAILFVAIGLVIGPQVLDELELESTSSTVQVLAEATLAFVLFSDASRINFSQLREGAAVPVRLLAIGLPLTIVLGTAAAAGLFEALTLGEALILAVVLAPTDAALGQAVVTEPRVPARIRQGLNVESGLNDGICVPLLFIAVATADVESEIAEGRSAMTLLGEEIGFGILGGVVAGLLIAAIVRTAGSRDLVVGQWLKVIPVAGAALAYGIADPLGGSGFIAAFVAGASFRVGLGRDPEKMNDLAEEVGNVLNGVTFLIFGAVLLGPTLDHVSWELAIYAVLSLTAVRMVPVAIALLGTRARWPTVGFVGWFGPRGLASIVFAVILLDESQLPHEDTILTAIYLTVGLSVLLHGITAAGLADRYAGWYEAHPRDGRPVMESTEAAMTRLRDPQMHQLSPLPGDALDATSRKPSDANRDPGSGGER